jgi:hypothetical protein
MRRIPHVARLLALAHHFEELLATGAVETQAELAKLTPARVTQIMNLLGLAPDTTGGDLLPAARDRGAAVGDGTRPAGRAADSGLEQAAGAMGGTAADALAACAW